MLHIMVCMFVRSSN